MSKKSVLISLMVHFSVWWLVSAWLWFQGFGWNLWMLLCPLAPLLLGPFYLKSHTLWAISVFSILSSAGLALLTHYSFKNGRRWIVALAHLSILIYWFIGLLLIAAQT